MHLDFDEELITKGLSLSKTIMICCIKYNQVHKNNKYSKFLEENWKKMLKYCLEVNFDEDFAFDNVTLKLEVINELLPLLPSISSPFLHDIFLSSSNFLQSIFSNFSLRKESFDREEDHEMLGKHLLDEKKESDLFGAVSDLISSSFQVNRNFFLKTFFFYLFFLHIFFYTFFLKTFFYTFFFFTLYEQLFSHFNCFRI